MSAAAVVALIALIDGGAPAAAPSPSPAPDERRLEQPHPFALVRRAPRPPLGAAPFASIAEATCPIAAPPDAVVSCPGWGEMTCRVRDGEGRIIRSRPRRALVLKKYRPAFPRPFVEHVYPLVCGGCDVPWNMLAVPKETWERKRKWELALCGYR